MLLGKKIQLEIVPGVNPSSDSTPLDTIFWTNADKIRFQGGKLRKLLGWQRIWPANGQQIKGTARNIFSYRDQNNNPITLIGTSTRLYAYAPLQGEDDFYNITPLLTSTTNIPNAFSTEYNTGVNVTISTVAKSQTITMDMTQYFQSGDLITISGVTNPINGIPAMNFNNTFPVEELNNSQVQFDVAVAATSTGSVTVNLNWASSYLYVNYNNNNLLDYDRIKFQLATDVDGVLAADINKEYNISNVVDRNNFTISTGIVATSKVTAGGGSSTTIQSQIAAGSPGQTDGVGFGAGEFGALIFGAANSAGITTMFPRIWSMDTFGTNVVLTPGDTPDDDPSIANLFEWANDVTVAPILISGAPNAVKWVYVSNNIVCTLGAAGVLNLFWGSGAGDYTVWTPGATNLANIQIFQQANAFLSQAKSRNYDMLFTSSAVYTMEFVGLPDIWLPRKLFSTDGILAPKARGVVEDAVFWMGQGDFYGFDGYTVSVLPNNTVKRYVFDNLNWSQYAKSFVHVDVEWSTVRFYYCQGQDIEPNSYVDYNYKEGHWTIGTNPRTASEEPVNINEFPFLVQSLATTIVPIPNGISTFFYNLVNNPFSTLNGSNVVSVSVNTDAIYLQVGDSVLISGATNTNGIPAGDLNGMQTITGFTEGIEGFGGGIFGFGEYGSPEAGATGFTFSAIVPATSAGTGGGAAVTVGTQILALNYTGNALQVNQVITIENATAVDGFTAAEINGTTSVRYIYGGYIEVNVPVSNAYSTSTVIDGGGTSAIFFTTTDGRLFQHNSGLNDYNDSFNYFTDPWNSQFAPMNSFAQTNYTLIQEGDNTQLIYSFYPDIIMQENMTLQVNVKEYAQSSHTHSQTFTMTPTTVKVDPMSIGRVRQYIFTSNVVNGNYLLGRMFEEIKPSTPR